MVQLPLNVATKLPVVALVGSCKLKPERAVFYATENSSLTGAQTEADTETTIAPRMQFPAFQLNIASACV